MNHQPLQILVHKSDSLVSANKEDLVDLAYVVIDVLAGVKSLPKPWAALKRSADGVIMRSSARGLSQFKLAYKEAVRVYRESIKEESSVVIESATDYSERESVFEYRLDNPSYFARDTTTVRQVDVESGGSETIIEEDSSLYREREDEFRFRLEQPGSFRRSNKDVIQK
tara:strand:+ start:76 stop:582 length:507 start_codon:yes stop_codon:yes gene_type:complete